MKIYHGITLAMSIAQSSAIPTVTWSACPLTTFDSGLGSHFIDAAKCAVYTPPLCHPGVCEASKSAKRNVDVFVKHLPATKVKPEKAKNVWLLQGGPMHNPTGLDVPTVYLYDFLEGKANVYTMDYRGTGRSEQLNCQASASSSLSDMDPLDVPECAQELEDKYGDLAAFSTTSAAKDLVNFISDYTNDFSTTIYGVGYGTIWVERVMHLNPPEVTGYVLDGVLRTSGATPDTFFNASSVDIYAGEIGDDFLSLCAKDSICNARFKKKGLQATIEHLMTKFDKNPSSTCAKIVKTLKSGQDDDSPSFVLRFLLGSLLQDPALRTFIPTVAYRLLRCEPNDADVLAHFINRLNQDMYPEDNKSTDYSVVLDNLVTFSEMWETPTPSVSNLKAQFEKTTLNAWQAYLQVPRYCAYSKEKSSVCDKLKLGDYTGNGIIYERDEYWNKPATIPSQASVLLMSSKLDPAAPYQYAKHLFDALDGENKELITFEYTAGGNLVDMGTYEYSCGLLLLVSYVQSSGNLDKLDKFCITDEKASLNWTTPIDYQYAFLSTDDAYDGEFDASLNASLSEQ
ncbi:hypothetical protein PHPALM_29267 [Phytophthora palmivora]|uniref:Serine protease family S33 n=1 Tax=Phytophthora palmivora TaxID=4796 RepID=A0A2P4X818_9STRA|nr:hypothetical protein PHPALM_29267 [Phytophthora palmivora]